METASGDSGQVRVRLAGRGEIAVNSAKRFCLGRRVIAVFNVEGEFYATDDTCTHGPSSLAEEGLIDGEFVECTLHGGLFHIPTGKPERYPPIAPLATYRVHVDSVGDLYVDLDTSQ